MMEQQAHRPRNHPAATVPKAVLFDAYGTLFDVYSVGLLAEQLFPGFGERLALRLGLVLDGAAEERLMNQYRHLSAFPENRAVLQALKDRGIRAGILSNGDPEMLEVAVRSAGLAELLSPLLSVHGLRRYKTDPAAYALGPQALQLPAREILFVSSNSWDAIGATWYGYTTLWVNRFQLPPEQLDTAPTHTGSSLPDVLALFPDTGQPPTAR